MAKPSPLLKHAVQKKTAEQIAIEEFMNTLPPTVVAEGCPIPDLSNTETIVLPDDSLDPFIESMDAAEALDDLASDVDTVTTAPAMESYRRIYTHMCSINGYPMTTSVEQFKHTTGGVRRLAKAIRDQADHIRSCVNLGFEDYVDNVDKNVEKTMDEYRKALARLNSMKHDPDMGHKITVINFKDMWDVFFIQGREATLHDFDYEIRGIKSIEELLSKGIDNIKEFIESDKEGVALSKFFNIPLLNNTTVKVTKGRAEFDKKEAPKPTREMTGSDWYIHLAYNLIGKDYKGGKGAEKTGMIQSVKVFHQVVDQLKKLGPVMDRIYKDVQELVDEIENCPDEKRAAVKRAASPVLELASNTLKHVTEITYSIAKAFEKFQAK